MNRLVRYAPSPALALIVCSDGEITREREFQSVEWDTDFAADGGPHIVFVLRNSGLTDACEVVLVIGFNGGEDRVYELGDIRAGETKVAFTTDFQSRLGLEVLRFQRVDPFRVHWSSPLGTPGTYRYDPPQIF